MKLKPLFKAFIFAFVALFIVSACKKEDEKMKKEITENIQNGTWRISKFIDSGSDETQDFAGFNFVFKSSGELTANNGGVSYTGTWSISDSNSNDDSTDDLHFNIHFNLSNEFEDLNDDWNISSQSDSQVELIDVSGGNGGTDYLTFVKI